ncbi:Serine/Threonine kinase domain protein (macronuclear) [Tetrahymena thermophila SB210]|uniref:Serine/Threonine kinase domain protein n=1 Tax=Tetrahymena thermophila (strain SB210) TaxID=312017 RepID=Q24G75_TETTS|nr:Serine/Threonine kinase domain protein [Tetrahymena thermophila SB210]EAS06778.2 Serine/Threonine kinase domain protein [Tetrahymena thermophila SB210]|eukprot:XP_001027020.2 Serine/Threonine kinase domain protein [Tetrahymena thermophila SB210]
MSKQTEKQIQNQSLNSATSGQIDEGKKSDFNFKHESSYSSNEKDLKQLLEISDILNKKKQPRSNKWELVNSVMNNLKDDSDKYLNQRFIVLEENCSQNFFKDKTVSKGSKSQNNSSADQLSNLSDKTIQKANFAQSKNDSSLGNTFQSQEESNYITIHKKSSKGSNQSNKIQEEIKSNKLASNQIIQAQSSQEVSANANSKDYSVVQKVNSESYEIEQKLSTQSIGKITSSSQSDGKDYTQEYSISSKSNSLSLSSKEQYNSSNQSDTISSKQSYTSSNKSYTSSNQSQTSSYPSQTNSKEQNALSKDSCNSSNESKYQPKDSFTSSNESNNQSKEQFNSSQQMLSQPKESFTQTSIKHQKKINQYQNQEKLAQNMQDDLTKIDIEEDSENFDEVINDQNIDILKEDTYMKIDQVITIDRNKAYLAISKSIMKFNEYLNQNKLRMLSKQTKINQVDQLEEAIENLKQSEQNHYNKQLIQQISDELKKKFIEEDLKDEEIIIKNKFLIEQIKNQVKCTNKKYIERIFVAIYRRRYKITKYLTSGGQADILIGTYLDDTNQEKEYVLRIVSSDQDTYDYIREEFELVNKFQKASNIIKYYDSIYLEDIYTGVFIVEKCSGSLTDTLRSKRNNNVNFTEQEIFKIVFDLVQGLVEMRSYNILHQDIKPDNILINRKGNYIYSDFGCSSKFLDGLAENKGFTMKYCAPEQLIEEYFTNYKADIYQLGRTIQQVLELYEKFRGVQTKFIKDLNNIIFCNMLQDQQDNRKECVDILILLSDSIVESQQKSYADKFIVWIEEQTNKQQIIQERETNFSLKSLITFHFIWFQLKLFQGGYQLLIQKKSEQQLLNEIIEKIYTDFSALKNTQGNIQFSQHLTSLLEILYSLVEVFNQQNNCETVYKIASFLMKISEEIDHQNEELFENAIRYLQQQMFKKVDFSKYLDQIEDRAESQNNCQLYTFLAYEYFHNDISKSFYYSLKVHAQNYQKYVEYSQTQNLNKSDFFTLGYYYLQSLFFITQIFTEINLDSIVINHIQFIRTISNNLKLGKLFERQWANLGLSFYNMKQYKKALVFFQEDIKQQSSENRNQSFNFAYSKFKIACCYFELGQFESAEKEFLELEEFFEKQLKNNQYFYTCFIKIKTFSYLGVNFDNKGQFKQSIIYHSKALQELENLNNKKHTLYQAFYPYCLFKLGMCYCQPDTYDQSQSIIYFTKFLETTKEKDLCELDIDQRQAVIVSLNGLAYFYFISNKFQESELYYTQLIRVFIQFSDYGNQIFEIGINNLMTTMIQLDQTENNFYLKFIDLVIEVVQGKKITDDQQKNNIIEDIQTAFQYSKELEQEDMFLKNNQLISLLEHFNLKEEIYITILNYQAQVLFESAQYDQAIIFYEKSLPTMINIYSHPNEFVAIVQSGLGMAYHQIRQFQVAINYYNSALKTMKDLDYYENEETHQDMIDCIDRILICFQGFGNTPLALEFYQNFEDIMPFLYEQSHPSIIKFNSQYETCKKKLNSL